MSENHNDLIQYLTDRLGEIPDDDALDATAITLDDQHHEIGAASGRFELLPGLLLRYAIDVADTRGSPDAKEGAADQSDAVQADTDPYPAHGGILAHLRDVLHDIDYESRATRKAHLDARTAALTAAQSALRAYSATVAALSADERHAFTYYITSTATADPQWRLGAALCSPEVIADGAIAACEATPQYLPPPRLVSLLAATDPHPSKHTLLVYLEQYHEQPLAYRSAFQHAVAATVQLGQHGFVWQAEPNVAVPFQTTPDNWFWPFAAIENEHIPDAKNVYIPEPSAASEAFRIGYASVPYESSRQQNGSGEDYLWFAASGKDDIFAVLADGASQSALGGVAADVFARMCMRFHRAHPQVLLNRADFLAICALAAAEARGIVHARIEAREAQKLDATVTRILRKRNTVGGSQAVFAVVQKTGNDVRVFSAGNVRVIIPGIIEHDSSLFASDAARFASLPAAGLLGTYTLEDYTLPDSAFRITIHSDALEGCAAQLARRGFLDETTLRTAAQADDTTYITFQYAPATH